MFERFIILHCSFVFGEKRKGISGKKGSKLIKASSQTTKHVNENGKIETSTIGNSSNIAWHSCSVEKKERQALLSQKGCVIWITGLSGSEYISGGTVSKILKEHGRLGELAIRSYTKQILSGLAYLHSKSTIHGDIKGDTILVDPHGSVKLGSLGTAKHAMATFKIGCTNELPTIPYYLSQEGKEFVRLCLQRNPLYRPTAVQLLKHPFVNSSSTPAQKLLLHLQQQVVM